MRAPFLSITLAGLLVLTSCSKEESGQTLIVKFGDDSNVYMTTSGWQNDIPIVINYKNKDEDTADTLLYRIDTSGVPGDVGYSMENSSGSLTAPDLVVTTSITFFLSASSTRVREFTLTAVVIEAQGKLSARDQLTFRVLPASGG